MSVDLRKKVEDKLAALEIYRDSHGDPTGVLSSTLQTLREARDLLSDREPDGEEERGLTMWCPCCEELAWFSAEKIRAARLLRATTGERLVETLRDRLEALAAEADELVDECLSYRIIGEDNPHVVLVQREIEAARNILAAEARRVDEGWEERP